MERRFYEEIAGIYRLRVPFENLYTSVFLVRTEEGTAVLSCLQDCLQHIG